MAKGNFSLNKIFVFRLSKIKEYALDLNRGLSSNFCWLKSANDEKFAEKCVICMKENFLVKIKIMMFTEGLKKGFAITSQSQNSSPSSENTLSPVNKKIQLQ